MRKLIVISKPITGKPMDFTLARALDALRQAFVSYSSAAHVVEAEGATETATIVLKRGEDHTIAIQLLAIAGIQAK